ncbi:hypothetical protein CM240_3155 [Clostridium bornimense]|uniref:Uncharacterized protein n=1 Tax=Clostridium bornimense TaxID=1216932 RepID=W6S789_9CLOT|nr:hypothetical protein [Clostridium bornimense]CDM70272.1 hypothetical protein CM240_3155 [Clostridium bornimense]
MKNIRKLIIFLIGIFIIFLLAINAYAIFTHNSLSSKVESLSETKTKISSLDSFKTIIVNLGNSQKFYLLTNEDIYKVKYNEYLTSAYDNLDDLVKSNTISENDKTNIMSMLKEYDNINTSLSKCPITYPLTDDIQINVTKSNELEINILHSISSAIASNTDSTAKNHASLSASINSEKSVIQLLTSVFTVSIGGPLCYVFKKYKNGELKLSDILDVLNTEEEKVVNYSNILTFASILNNHNKEMKKQWLDVQNLVETLQNSIVQLKNKVNEAKIPLFSDTNSEIMDIEMQLLEIKLLVK